MTKQVLQYLGVLLGSVLYIALLCVALWFDGERAEREADQRRTAQQAAYARANRVCGTSSPARFTPHSGLTWWIEVKCLDGSVRAVTLSNE